METGLGGRTALVSGGSGGIGRAIALALAQEGASVALTWRSGSDRAQAVADEISAGGGKALAARLDQRDAAAAAALVKEVADWARGPVSVLVANAVEWPTAQLEPVDLLADSLTVNAVGTAALIEAALPGMREQGWGRVVILSSDIVAQPMGGSMAYAAAKGGLESAARVLAVREAPGGVLTNVVRPGLTLTDRVLGVDFIGQEGVDREGAETPTGRICTPEEVASLVTYLGSAANGHVNGQIISVAGGRELTR